MPGSQAICAWARGTACNATRSTGASHRDSVCSGRRPRHLPYLLLVVPALVVFPANVQPVRTPVVACPCDAEEGGRFEVLCLEAFGYLPPGEFEQINHKPRADALRGPHPNVVEVVEESAQSVESIDLPVGRGERLAVPAVGELPYVAIEQVRRDVADPPLVEGTGLPFSRRE